MPPKLSITLNGESTKLPSNKLDDLLEEGPVKVDLNVLKQQLRKCWVACLGYIDDDVLMKIY